MELRTTQQMDYKRSTSRFSRPIQMLSKYFTTCKYRNTVKLMIPWRIALFQYGDDIVNYSKILSQGNRFDASYDKSHLQLNELSLICDIYLL